MSLTRADKSKAQSNFAEGKKENEMGKTYTIYDSLKNWIEIERAEQQRYKIVANSVTEGTNPMYDATELVFGQKGNGEDWFDHSKDEIVGNIYFDAHEITGASSVREIRKAFKKLEISCFCPGDL